jgi:hypothetical protein
MMMRRHHKQYVKLIILKSMVQNPKKERVLEDLVGLKSNVLNIWRLVRIASISKEKLINLSKELINILRKSY